MGSTNTAALRTAAVLAPPGVEGLLYEGLGQLPLFNPDDDREGAELHPEVVSMRAEIAHSDAILICTPEYAGALPAALKNLLEWTIGDAGTYGKAVVGSTYRDRPPRRAARTPMSPCARSCVTRERTS